MVQAAVVKNGGKNLASDAKGANLAKAPESVGIAAPQVSLDGAQLVVSSFDTKGFWRADPEHKDVVRGIVKGLSSGPLADASKSPLLMLQLTQPAVIEVKDQSTGAKSHVLGDAGDMINVNLSYQLETLAVYPQGLEIAIEATGWTVAKKSGNDVKVFKTYFFQTKDGPRPPTDEEAKAMLKANPPAKSSYAKNVADTF